MTAFDTEPVKREIFPSFRKNKILFFETEAGKKLVEDIERLRNKKIVENERKEYNDKTN